MDLFTQPEQQSFEKVALEVALPEDPNLWPQEILQELYKQVPYISDFEPHVIMDRVEAEQGYGLGYAEVMNKSEVQANESQQALAAAGIRQVRIPIVIKAGKLQSFDIMITDDAKTLPLTEMRLRAAIFRPQAFDITSQTPGDQSMVGQLYPPYRQNQGFGGAGGGMSMGGKEASASPYDNWHPSDPRGHGPGGSDLERFIASDTKTAGRMSNAGEGAAKGSTVGAIAGPLVGAALSPGNRLEGAYRGSLAGTLGGAALGGAASALRKPKPATGVKTAAAIDEYFLTSMKQGRFGKKEASGNARIGMWDDFMSKCASSGLSLLQAVSPTISDADYARFRAFCTDLRPGVWQKNAAALLPSFQHLLNNPPGPRMKTASIFGLVPNSVAQVTRLGGATYALKTASHVAWAPAMRSIDRGELVKLYGTKVAFDVDTAGSATIAEDGAEAPPDQDMAASGPITESGMYRVHTADGEELVGAVLCNLVDVDGTQLPLALFTNGSQSAIQADIVGSPLESGEMPALPTADAPSGTGFFFGSGPEGVLATIPLTMQGSFQAPQTGGGTDPITHQATTFDGRQIQVSRQPQLQTVQGMEGEMLVPEGWQWSPLGRNKAVALLAAEPAADDGSLDAAPEEGMPQGEEAANPKMAARREKLATVVIRSAGGQRWSFEGAPVAKLASSEVQDLDTDGSIFLLGALGVHLGYGAEKLAEALTGRAPVLVKVSRSIDTQQNLLEYARKTAAAAHARHPSLKRDLWKEATELPDPTAVDTVLSLGFLNPENLMTFVGFLPTIEQSQQKLCELLLAARLGLPDCSVTALERAIRTTEEVLEGLKALAFQQN